MRKARFLSFVVICIIFSAASWAAPVNFLLNGGFEEVDPENAGWPLDWSENWLQEGGQVQVIENPLVATEGNSYLKTTGTSSQSCARIRRELVGCPKPAGKRIRVSFDYNSTGVTDGNTGIVLIFEGDRDGDGAIDYLGAQDFAIPKGDSNGWLTREFVATVPEYTTALFITLGQRLSVGTVSWDNIRVWWVEDDEAFRFQLSPQLLRGVATQFGVTALNTAGEPWLDFPGNVNVSVIDTAFNPVPEAAYNLEYIGKEASDFRFSFTPTELCPELIFFQATNQEEPTLRKISMPIIVKDELLEEVTGSRNLVYNPSFELIENGKPKGWGTPPTNWELITGSAQAYQGQRCLKTWSDNVTGKVVINQFPISNLVYSSKNPRFRVSARYKTEGQLIAAPVLALEFWQYKDGKYTFTGDTQAKSGSTNTNGLWETLEIEFDVYPNTNQVWLNLRNFDSKGIVYWDEIEIVWINSDQAFALTTPERITLGEKIPFSITALGWEGTVIPHYYNTAKIVLLDEEGRELPADAYAPNYTDGFIDGSVAAQVELDASKLESLPSAIKVKVVDAEEATLTATSSPIALDFGSPEAISIVNTQASIIAGTETEVIAYVVNEKGAPMRGVEVRFVLEGEGSISAQTAQTDHAGQGKIIYRAPGYACQAIISATLASNPAITAQKTIRVATEKITIDSLPTEAVVGSTIDLVVRLNNVSGEPVSGKQLSFQVPAEAQVELESDITNSQGEVAARLTLPQKVGSFAFSVTVVDFELIFDYSLKLVPKEPALLELESAKGQDPAPSYTSILAIGRVTDQYGNLVADGTEVTFQVKDSGQAQTSITTSGIAKAFFNFEAKSEAVILQAESQLAEAELTVQLAAKANLDTAQRTIITKFPASLSWQGEAESFKLQVAQDLEFKKQVSEQVVAEDNFEINSLPEGTYYWRVLTGNDFSTVSSEARCFVVINAASYLLPFAEVYPRRLDATSPYVSFAFVLKEDSFVTLKILDLSGAEKMTILNDVLLPAQASGQALPYKYQWDGVDNRGRQLSNGLYLCLFLVENQNGDSMKAVRRVVIVR